MNHADLKSQLDKGLPNVKTRLVRESLLIENPKDLPLVARYLLNNALLKLDYLSSVTGADYLTYLESVYHFYSTKFKNGPVTIRVRTERNQPVIPSIVSLYRSAEFQEREAYDMYGIIYEGHPDLRRIFMWEGFEGFPMRKDYIQEDSETLETADVQWLDSQGIKVPDTMRQTAENLKREGKRAVSSSEGKEV